MIQLHVIRMTYIKLVIISDILINMIMDFMLFLMFLLQNILNKQMIKDFVMVEQIQPMYYQI